MSTDLQNSTSLKYNLLGSFSIEGHPDDWDINGYKEKIAKLSDYDVEDCAFQAAVNGNVQLLRLLFQEKGQIEVNYENKAPNLRRHILNGVTYDMTGIKRLKDLKSVAHFKDLLRAIDEFGIRGLSEPGETYPALFHRIDDNKVITGLSVERFSGDLPELSGGVLKSPELAIALKHEEATNPHSSAYRPILCWASPEMVESFPGSLAPLTPFQQVSSFSGVQSMRDFKADVGSSTNMLFHSIKVGVEPSVSAVHAALLMKSLCPVATFNGFDDPQGRVLCETNTDFLLRFPLVGLNAGNTKAAKDFAQGYCPIELIATKAIDSCVDDYGHPDRLWFMKAGYSTEHDKSYSDIFAMAGDDHPLKDRARQMMEPAQWKALLHKADTTLIASSMIAMHQAFGFDNKGLRITVTGSEIEQYLAANFRFSDDSNFFDTTKRFKAHLDQTLVTGTTAVLSTFSSSSLSDRGEPQASGADILEVATKNFQDVVIKLNLWPSDSERPKDLADALRMAGPLELTSWGNNRAMGLRAILVDSGLNACTEIAKTPRAWLKLTEVFPRDEIDPYIKQMPREAKGKLLEQDLGM